MGKKHKKTRKTPKKECSTVEPKISKEELNDSIPQNLTLRFSKESGKYEEMLQMKKRFIKALEGDGTFPKGRSKPIADGAKRGPVSHRNVECLLANLFYMQRKGKSTLAVSLRKCTYSSGELSGGMINLIKLAAHLTRGLFVLKKGCHHENNKKIARIKPTDKFNALLSSEFSEDDIAFKLCDLITLRNKKKDTVPQKEWEKTIKPEQAAELEQVKESLECFNRVYEDYSITYEKDGGGEGPISPRLHAVYNEDFDHGGRLYTSLNGHQGLSKKERSTIKFNGKPTVELDYGGLHPRILYHMKGEHYPLKEEPYSAVLDSMELDSELIFKNHPSIRNDLKIMLLALINGKGRRGNRDWTLFNSWMIINNPSKKEEAKVECEARKERWIESGLCDAQTETGFSKDVQEAFYKAHKPIESYFCSGIGIRLQNIDARIARLVMIKMMRSNQYPPIPVLPVHDSFITFVEHEKKLRVSMKRAYKIVLKRETGLDSRFRIPIK